MESRQSGFGRKPAIAAVRQGGERDKSSSIFSENRPRSILSSRAGFAAPLIRSDKLSLRYVRSAVRHRAVLQAPGDVAASFAASFPTDT